MGKRAKRINAFDIILVVLVIALIVAFLFRTQIRDLFATKGERIVTYSFNVENLDPAVAAYLHAETELLSEDGSSVGTVLVCNVLPGSDEKILTDGTVVQVENGKMTLSGNITAKGYVSDDFIYLNNGTLLVSGDRMTVYTDCAMFNLMITAVQVQ